MWVHNEHNKSMVLENLRIVMELGNYFRKFQTLISRKEVVFSIQLWNVTTI